jgi:hypothetical protein
MNSKTPYNPTKAAQKAARTAHFAKGGTCKTWIGAPATFKDGKKEANRKACRSWKGD